MLYGDFTFSKHDLLEQSNVYIRCGEIVKLRYMNFKDGWYERLDRKRIYKEILSEDEFDYLKGFNKVVVEDKHGVSFYNFNGSLSLI